MAESCLKCIGEINIEFDQFCGQKKRTPDNLDALVVLVQSRVSNYLEFLNPTSAGAKMLEIKEQKFCSKSLLNNEQVFFN